MSVPTPKQLPGNGVGRCMRQVTLPLPELAVIAATRAMGAAGAALLASPRVPESRRRRIGWLLLGIGLLTTVPLILDVVRRARDCD